MKRIIILSGIIFLVLLIYFYEYSLKDINEEVMFMVNNVTSKNATIRILYDNYEYDERLKTGFEFSCLVEIDNRKLLFDTGSDSETLLHNMKQLGIDPKTIESVVISHNHWDHTGGLSGFLEANGNKAKVYNPTTFSKPTKIYDNIFSTGALGISIKEQSLLVNTNKGLVVITGCAHPGIVKIVKKSKEIKKEIYLVTGGFHLGDASDADLKQIIDAFRELDVKKVGPCHCSGDRCRELFEEEYEDDFVEVGVGKIIKI